MWIHLNRLNKGDLDFQALGELRVYDNDNVMIKTFFTVEPPWKQNRTDISCIYNGRFRLVKRWSEQYGNHFHIVDTYGRTVVLIHVGNYRKNTKGCILPGKGFVDIDKDGHLDTTSSGDTMKELNKLMPFESEILITSEFSLTT